MQKISIIGFFEFFENSLQWQFEVGKKCLQMAIVGYIFIYVQTKYQYVFDNSAKILSYEKFGTITVRKCLPEGPSQSG
jgi:hypothetical protein